MILCLTVLDILDYEYANSKLRTEKLPSYIAEKIQIVTINLGESRYLEVPEITDYESNFIIQKFKTTDTIWHTEIIKINEFG